MTAQALRGRLEGDGSAIGIFSKCLDSGFIEAAGLGGLDFIILDNEHGHSSLETIHNHVRAARLGGTASIIRVKGVDHHAIGSALDSGADGVQVPNVETVEQAQAAVRAARFHPLGARGVCRFVRAAEHGAMDRSDYFGGANEKVLVLQVEGLTGMANLDAILDVPGFDVLFIGPYDLSQAVGRPGEVESAEVREKIDAIVAAAKARGKAVGVFCDTPDSLARFRAQGIDYIAHSVDISLFRDAIRQLVEKNA